MSTYRCCHCKQVKDTTEFNHNNQNKRGHDYRCKVCRSLKHKVNKAATRAQRAQISKRWITKNRDANLARRRANYANNPVHNLSQRLMTTLTHRIKKGWGERCVLNEVVGLSYNELIQKIGKPQPGYHLEHICPRSQAQTVEEVKLLFNWRNLKWVKMSDNLTKSWLRTTEAEFMCRTLLGRDWISKCNDSL
jgi:hypothetical protein